MLMALAFAGEVAEASNAQGLPWETGLETLGKSMTGPVAFRLGTLMFVAGVAGVMFGGDLNGWIRWVALAAILAAILGSNDKMLQLFGLTSTLVP